MRCEEFEERLNVVLDQRRRPEWDLELRLHYDTCAECRQMATAYESLLDGFHALAIPEPPSDMPDRVLDQVHYAPPVRRLPLAAAALAAAASLLLAAMPIVRTTWHSRPHANDGPPRLMLARFDLLSQLRFIPELFFFLGSHDEEAYAGLAKETGQGLATVVLAMPGIGGSMGIMESELNPDRERLTWNGPIS
ncbi:MAG TPA: hypothetical protein VHV08_11475, partial [Pirellulales bacterium]|nr:hypothetical protein [Pirellulales bacterium]